MATLNEHIDEKCHRLYAQCHPYLTMIINLRRGLFWTVSHVQHAPADASRFMERMQAHLSILIIIIIQHIASK